MSLQASHFLHPIQSFPSPKTNGITKADNFITCRRNLVNPKMFFVSMSIDPRKTSITTSVSTSRTLILRSREQMNCLFTVLFTWVVTWLTVPFRGRLRLRGVKNVNFSVKSSSVVASYSVDKAKIGGGRREVGEDERRKMAIRRLEEGNDGNSERDFSLLVMEKGRTIFTQSWRSLFTKTKGLVVLLHGLNEHSGRYNDFAKKLNANGYKVYGMDWIGHGGSDGLHAYVHCLDDAVADMKAFLQEVIAESPGLPCFCFGHSTGAAIILKAVMNPDVEAHVAGIVVTSPAVRVQPSHPLVPVIAPFVSLLLPKHQLRAGNTKRVLVSRDPEALVAKYSDPLVYTGSIRARTGYEILRVTYYLQQNLKRLRVPFLVLHGSADTITDPKASVELYEEASSADKTIKVYDGFYHDLLFEPERDSIMRDIIEWLNCRLKSLADSK